MASTFFKPQFSMKRQIRRYIANVAAAWLIAYRDKPAIEAETLHLPGGVEVLQSVCLFL